MLLSLELALLSEARFSRLIGTKCVKLFVNNTEPAVSGTSPGTTALNGPVIPPSVTSVKAVSLPLSTNSEPPLSVELIGAGVPETGGPELLKLALRLT